MAYEPGERGPYPVGVRTEEWRDDNNGISYPVEIYYPATSEYVGIDLDPAQQDTFENLWEPGAYLKQAAVRDATPPRMPSVHHQHAWLVRLPREFTYLSTHLASHGYLVVSPTSPEVRPQTSRRSSPIRDRGQTREAA